MTIKVIHIHRSDNSDELSDKLNKILAGQIVLVKQIQENTAKILEAVGNPDAGKIASLAASLDASNKALIKAMEDASGAVPGKG